MDKTTIDRFEGDLAVLQFEDGSEALWPASKLPAGSKEGNVLMISLSPDAAAEKELRDSISDIQKRLKDRKK